MAAASPSSATADDPTIANLTVQRKAPTRFVAYARAEQGQMLDALAESSTGPTPCLDGVVSEFPLIGVPGDLSIAKEATFERDRFVRDQDGASHHIGGSKGGCAVSHTAAIVSKPPLSPHRARHPTLRDETTSQGRAAAQPSSPRSNTSRSRVFTLDEANFPNFAPPGWWLAAHPAPNVALPRMFRAPLKMQMQDHVLKRKEQLDLAEWQSRISQKWPWFEPRAEAARVTRYVACATLARLGGDSAAGEELTNGTEEEKREETATTPASATSKVKPPDTDRNKRHAESATASVLAAPPSLTFIDSKLASALQSQASSRTRTPSLRLVPSSESPPFSQPVSPPPFLPTQRIDHSSVHPGFRPAVSAQSSPRHKPSLSHRRPSCFSESPPARIASPRRHSSIEVDVAAASRHAPSPSPSPSPFAAPPSPFSPSPPAFATSPRSWAELNRTSIEQVMTSTSGMQLSISLPPSPRERALAAAFPATAYGSPTPNFAARFDQQFRQEARSRALRHA